MYVFAILTSAVLSPLNINICGETLRARPLLQSSYAPFGSSSLFSDTKGRCVAVRDFADPADHKSKIIAFSVREQSRREIEVGNRVVCGTFLGDDGRFATASEDGVITVWRHSDGARLLTATFPGEAFSCMCFDRTNEAILVGDLRGNASVISSRNLSRTQRSVIANAAIDWLIAIKGGDALALVAGRLVRRDAASGTNKQLELDEAVLAVDVTPDGNRFIIATRKMWTTGSTALFAVGDSRHSRTLGRPPVRVHAVDNNTFLIAEGREIEHRDLETGRLRFRYTMLSDCTGIAPFATDRLAVLGGALLLEIVNIADGRPKSYRPNHWPTGLVKSVVPASSDKTYLIDTAFDLTRYCVGSPGDPHVDHAEKDVVSAVASGESLFLLSTKGQLTRVNAKSGSKQAAQVIGVDARGFCDSPDGGLLWVSGRAMWKYHGDRSVLIGVLPADLTSVVSSQAGIFFSGSQDGQVFSGAADGEKIRDVKKLFVCDTAVSSICVSPSGRSVAAVCDSGQVVVYDVLRSVRSGVLFSDRKSVAMISDRDVVLSDGYCVWIHDVISKERRRIVDMPEGNWAVARLGRRAIAGSVEHGVFVIDHTRNEE